MKQFPQLGESARAWYVAPIDRRPNLSRIGRALACVAPLGIAFGPVVDLGGSPIDLQCDRGRNRQLSQQVMTPHAR